MRGHVIVGVMTISTDVDKLYDTDLSDAAWALIAPMLPAARPGGRPRNSNSAVLPIGIYTDERSQPENGLAIVNWFCRGGDLGP
jgi:hypothetical protein